MLLDKFIPFKKKKREDSGGMVEEHAIGDCAEVALSDEAASSDGIIVGFAGLDAVAASTDSVIEALSEGLEASEQPAPQKAEEADNDFAFDLDTPSSLGITAEDVKGLSGAFGEMEM